MRDEEPVPEMTWAKAFAIAVLILTGVVLVIWLAVGGGIAPGLTEG